jgi:hypothetical protein
MGVRTAERKIGRSHYGKPFFIAPVFFIVEYISFGVQTSLGVNTDFKTFFSDHSDKTAHKRLGIIGLIHALDGVSHVACCFFSPLFLLCFFKKLFLFGCSRCQLQSVVTFGNLLHGFTVGCIADKQAEIGYAVEFRRNRFETDRKK